LITPAAGTAITAAADAFTLSFTPNDINQRSNKQNRDPGKDQIIT
jgi:hypothetical protein